jgi:hypothetical protein
VAVSLALSRLVLSVERRKGSCEICKPSSHVCLWCVCLGIAVSKLFFMFLTFYDSEEYVFVFGACDLSGLRTCFFEVVGPMRILMSAG